MSALAMFRKTAHGDIRKSAQKVSDPKKDTPTRLKHLRLLLENYDIQEQKTFFEAHYSHIYYIFYDIFVNVESELKQRANKSHREELEGILQIFEKILVLLPELIHKTWMFHSIGRIMKILLHPGNGLKLRREGMRLFIIWYQILQENASEECHHIFLNLVPGLGGTESMDITRPQSSNFEGSEGIIAAGEITSILPSAGEKLPENITQFFLESLLSFLVSEVIKVEWLNKNMRETSFVFLFDKFKSSYLKWLLPNFDMERSIYDPALELPKTRKMCDLKVYDEPSSISQCRDSFVCWLATFASSSKKSDSSIMKGLSCSALTEPVSTVDEQRESSDCRRENPDQVAPGSTTSMLSTGLQGMEKDSANSSISSEDHSLSEYEIVRSVLYSTRENVNVVHETFRQALLFSLRHAGAMRRVIAVYKDWFQHVEQVPPVFMQEPTEDGQGVMDVPDFYHRSLSDIMEEDCSSDESAVSSIPRLALINDLGLDKSHIRNASYLGAIQELADQGERHQYEVRAGLQKVLQVFITSAANIFLLKADEEESLLQEQVDLCKRVLNIYRHVVMNIKMGQRTWEQMLLVLLSVTSGVLQKKPPPDRLKSLGGRLAQPIFQTLIVTWIKANLSVYISADLWHQFLKVLSSLTSWIELIKEWAKTMETLTRVLARQVYSLDLYDLPLFRLSEQKEKKRRGKTQVPPKNKENDQTFSRACIQNDAAMPRVLSGMGSNLESSFERVKSKSEGAGGYKSRPDLPKQRSLSGEPSPSHSRTASVASDAIIRSSSEGNIADPRELAERLKGAAAFSSEMGTKGILMNETSAEAVGGMATEDQEVAVLTTAMDDCSSQASADVVHGKTDSLLDSISLEKSDMEVRVSRSPSPVSNHSKSDSRSPSPASELAVDIHQKDSPTPDRDSLHIDVVAGSGTGEVQVNRDAISGIESEEFKSVLAGGSLTGWTSDVAVVLWRRMLGALGDINLIEDPEIHSTVYDYLCDLLNTITKIRENLGVTPDNQSSPAPPELIPPHRIFASWLFGCLQLPQKYKSSKLMAYQLLCQMVVHCTDTNLPPDILIRFYQVVHHGLVSMEQDTINVIMRHCGTSLFSASLPGATLLVMDYISAASTIISTIDLKETSRADAISLLGALLCFPNHFGDLTVLKSEHEDLELISCADCKDQIINLLLKAGNRETAGLAKCIALSSLGIFLYEELSHSTLHPKLKEAINILLVALKSPLKMVAKVASDMLLLLCDHVATLLSYHPDLPRKILEAIALTVPEVMPNQDRSSTDEDKRLLVSMLFCTVEWCIKMPMHLLLEMSDTDQCVLHKVFCVLNAAVTGQNTNSLSRGSFSLSDSVSELETNKDLSSLNSSKLSSGDGPETPLDRPRSPNVFETPKQPETDIVKLAARMLTAHLVNHLGHFPMADGAAKLNSSVQEHHDLPNVLDDDLKPQIFSAENVQFFVLNHRTLISFVELPALLDVPGGGVTAGLTTAKSVCRVVMRDLCGKFCWESSVLYGPPWCQKGSALKDATNLLRLSSDMEFEPLLIQEESDLRLPEQLPKRSFSTLPDFENTREGDDNLDDLLRHVGYTSPECLLSPGVQLNIAAPIPDELSEQSEDLMTNMVLHQKEAELNYYSQHKSDTRMVANPQLPTEVEDPVSPFQISRMLLDQMGLLSWEKRCHFDLMKKSDKLLRELKNLDIQKCRETHKIAVIYVAEGQEDKFSILSNSGGSKAYENFVSGLGWEIDLDTHPGFLGGLQQNKTTGDTAPYYANSTCEVIFHVSTRMPSGSDSAIHIKMRHLGNDEVHIVWSEHWRDYRRGIIPTEFGDVLIIIYPLRSGLYRIHINKKPETPFFGPLFNGAVVNDKILPGLVRATAVNASRTKRSLMPFYHSYYEERAKCLETIIQQHTEPTMFEDFAANVFAPMLPENTGVDQASIADSTSNTDSLRSATATFLLSPSARHTRGGDSGFEAAAESFVKTAAKRLSLKGRKSSVSRLPLNTPPGSPNVFNNKK